MIDIWLYQWPNVHLTIALTDSTNLIYRLWYTPTPDWTSDFILTDFITFYSCFICYFCFISVYILSSSAHLLYACAPSTLFYTLIRSLLTILDLHIQILDALLYWSGVQWYRTCREEHGVTLGSIIGILPFFHSVDSFSLRISLSYHPIPFLCSLLSCVDIYICIAVIMIYDSRFL